MRLVNFLLLYVAASFAAAAAVADETQKAFSVAAAVKYAQGALIEFNERTGLKVSKAAIAGKPVVLSGSDGKLIVLVLYPDGAKHYFVGLRTDKDGNLQVFSRGVTYEPAENVVAAFGKQPFMPGE